MKKLIILLSLCLTIISLNAQTPPNAFNYSAVARNPSGVPIANSAIGIQITILKSSPTGTSEYVENHVVNTDEFGLFNLIIGGGAIQNGSFENIDWGSDNYFLQVGMDVSGGTNFVLMGTTQFVSVPYALHAKNAETLVNNNGIFGHFIGEDFGGGLIFYLWKDQLGVEHGLIVDKNELSTSQVWSNMDQTLIGSTSQSTWDGLSNSNAIVGQLGHTNSAASLCLNSNNGGQNDWYLPSIQELALLWQNCFIVNKNLSSINGTEVFKCELNTTGSAVEFLTYWSSTETGQGSAFYFIANSGTPGNTADGGLNKNSPRNVRAIRKF
jgi:hypothetical protein